MDKLFKIYTQISVQYIYISFFFFSFKQIQAWLQCGLNIPILWNFLETNIFVILSFIHNNPDLEMSHQIPQSFIQKPHKLLQSFIVMLSCMGWKITSTALNRRATYHHWSSHIHPPSPNNDHLLCYNIWCEIIYSQYVTIITVTNVCSRQTMSPPIIKKIQFEQGFIKESTSLKIQCCIMYLVITLPACLWHVWAFFNKPPGSWDSAEQADRLRSWDIIVIALYLQSTRNPGCLKKNANMVNIHNYSIEGVSCLTASLRTHTQKINLWISSSASRSQRASSISQNKRNSITLHCALFLPTATLFSL